MKISAQYVQHTVVEVCVGKEMRSVCKKHTEMYEET